MDLNELYFAHGLALMRAHATSSTGLERTCLEDAARLARRIYEAHAASGAAAAVTWTPKT